LDKSNNIIQEGNIILYKPITTQDEINLILEWRNKDRIRINMINDHIITVDEHKKWIKSINNDNSKLYLIAYDKIKPKKAIGLACIMDINYDLLNCTWGFYIGEDDYLGKGHAVEMEYLILKHIFEDMNMHRLFCFVLDFNKPVISFHKKFGFIEEGKYREYLFREGRWVDAILLSILKDEYLQKRHQLVKMIAFVSKKQSNSKEI